MANRNFCQFSYSFIKAKVSLYAYVAIGAVGAPTLTAASSYGVSSISRTGAGTYLVTFADRYTTLLKAGYTLEGSAASGVFKMQVTANAIASATPTLTLKFYDAAEAAVDPASGTVLHLDFVFKNTSVAG